MQGATTSWYEKYRYVHSVHKLYSAKNVMQFDRTRLDFQGRYDRLQQQDCSGMLVLLENIFTWQLLENKRADALKWFSC